MPDQSGNPTLLEQLQQAREQQYAPGILGGIQKAFQVANTIGNGQGIKDAQDRQIAEGLASTPEAQGLSAPYQQAAAQMLNENKIGEFQQLLKEHRYAQHEAARQQKEGEVSSAFEAMLPQIQQRVTPESFSYIQALHKSGNTPEAYKAYMNEAQKAQTEGVQNANTGIQALQQENKDQAPDKDTGKLVGLFNKVKKQNITADDLANLSDKEVFKKYGLSQTQAEQIKSGVDASGAKLKPSLLERGLSLVGIKPQGIVDPKAALDAGLQSKVAPEDLQDFQSRTAQAQIRNAAIDQLKNSRDRSLHTGGPKAANGRPSQVESKDWDQASDQEKAALIQHFSRKR